MARPSLPTQQQRGAKRGPGRRTADRARDAPSGAARGPVPTEPCARAGTNG